MGFPAPTSYEAPRGPTRLASRQREGSRPASSGWRVSCVSFEVVGGRAGCAVPGCAVTAVRASPSLPGRPEPESAAGGRGAGRRRTRTRTRGGPSPASQAPGPSSSLRPGFQKGRGVARGLQASPRCSPEGFGGLMRLGAPPPGSLLEAQGRSENAGPGPWSQECALRRRRAAWSQALRPFPQHVTRFPRL